MDWIFIFIIISLRKSLWKQFNRQTYVHICIGIQLESLVYVREILLLSDVFKILIGNLHISVFLTGNFFSLDLTRQFEICLVYLTEDDSLLVTVLWKFVLLRCFDLIYPVMCVSQWLL